jgi:L-rhamnose 1-dehydrogenase
MVARGLAGAIINTSSAGQVVAASNLTRYCVAKAGIEMLTKQLALELAPHRIRVNAICPGLIETELNRADIADPAFRERRLARIPLRQIGAPDDVVGAVVFLAATPEPRLVTGASVFIDGGQTIWGA